MSSPYKTKIVSRKGIIDLLTRINRPISFEYMVEELAYQSDEDKRQGLMRRLQAMQRDAQILQNRNHKYGLPAKMDLIIGTVEGHPEGFGFLLPEGGGEDLFLHQKQMRRLMHGDRILAQIAGVNQRGKPEAKLVEVLERANKQLVARFITEQGLGLGIPVNSRIKHEIIIPPDAQLNAKDNQMILIEIMQQPEKRMAPLGKVLEVLGDHMAPGMEIEVAMHAWNIPHKWPESVKNAAGRVEAVVKDTEKSARVDIRDIPLVTIDGEDARDFDDAIWCEANAKGWRALVAIADVSHYVAVDSKLDAEAKLRGNSVYFPDFVVPMLPKTLSNGICSLNPEVERLCFVCDMQISAEGRVTRSKFYQGLMSSHARLTYTEVGKLFRGEDDVLGKKLPGLFDLHNLYKALKLRRYARGTINFSRIETRFLFDENKKITEIVPLIRNDAHKLVEELMIAANIESGKFLQKHKIPGLYRVHEAPATDKIDNLRSFLKDFGLQLGGGQKPAPKDYSKVLSQAKGRPQYNLIQTVLLKSMRQAHYTAQNSGHFGLAHDVYAHFTSPIRRYPDLLVHRALKHILNGNKPEDFAYLNNEMQKLGEHCSMTERRADDATRDVDDFLKCEYMQDKIGEVFAGVVASVAGFGLFVRLNDSQIDGLLHISMLEGDYYHFDPIRHSLKGENSGRVYKLGDELTIKVIRVDIDERKIDFALPHVNGNNKKRKSKQKKRR